MKKLKDIFGSGPLSIFIVVLLAIVLLKIESVFNLKKIVLNNYLVLLIFFFIFAGFIVLIYSVISLPLSKRGKQLVTNGAYKYVRHPIYSSIIYLFYPALALILKSGLLLLATFIVYLIFKILVVREEKHLIEIFGKKYIEYMKKVSQFFPRLF